MATSKLILRMEMRSYARPLLIICVCLGLHKIDYLWSKIIKLSFKMKIGKA